MSSKSSLRLRLQRWGRLHRPFYRIVACSRYAPRDGKFHEILGTYDPIPDHFGNKQLTLKVDRIKYWMSAGAEPTERVGKILGIAEIIPPPPRRSLAREILAPLETGNASEMESEVEDAEASPPPP